MVCTFFGHKDTPKEIEPTLRSTLIDLIENKNVNVFYVGNNGNFDTMVRRQLEDLSQTYPITYSVVLAYLPTEKNKYDNFEQLQPLDDNFEHEAHENIVLILKKE